MGQTSQPVLFDIASGRHTPGEVTTKENEKARAGTVEVVDGQGGKAAKFSFVESASAQLFTAWVNSQQNWDQYEGFSFWGKGDGSKSCKSSGRRS